MVAKYIILMLSKFFEDITACIIVENAHFVDEMSWQVLSRFKEHQVNLLIAMTLVGKGKANDSAPAPALRRPASAHLTTLGSSHLVRSEIQAVKAKQHIAVVNNGSENIDNIGPESKGYNYVYESSEAFASIIDEPTTVEIYLPPLSRPELREVITRILQLDATSAARLPEELIRQILTATAGNLYWVKEMGEFIKTQGLEGYLSASKHNKSHMKDPLKHLVRAKLDKLDSDTLGIIKKASVLGFQFSLTLLESLTTGNDVSPASTRSSLLAPPSAVGATTVSASGASTSGAVLGMSDHIRILRDLGLIQCLEEAPLMIYSFHNQLIREVGDSVHHTYYSIHLCELCV